MPAIPRFLAAGLAAASCLLVGAAPQAQSAPADLTIEAGGRTFTLPALSSLSSAAGALAAERVLEDALKALGAEVRAAQKEIDQLEVRLAANGEALKEESGVFAEARRSLEPALEAYDAEEAAVRADDLQLRTDQAPVQALIDEYNRTPDEQRTAEMYDRIAELKKPLDARLEALKARKSALDARYRALEKEWNDQGQALADLQKLDKELRAERDSKTATLEAAYRQLKAGSDYATGVSAALERMNRTPPATLAPLVGATRRILEELSSLGLDAERPN